MSPELIKQHPNTWSESLGRWAWLSLGCPSMSWGSGHWVTLGTVRTWWPVVAAAPWRWLDRGKGLPARSESGVCPLGGEPGKDYSLCWGLQAEVPVLCSPKLGEHGEILWLGPSLDLNTESWGLPLGLGVQGASAPLPSSRSAPTCLPRAVDSPGRSLPAHVPTPVSGGKIWPRTVVRQSGTGRTLYLVGSR